MNCLSEGLDGGVADADVEELQKLFRATIDRGRPGLASGAEACGWLASM